MKKQEKEEFVGKLKEKVQKARALFFADYRGISASQISQLRRQVSLENAELRVTKNTLLRRALQSSIHPTTPAGLLEGPTATIFAYQDEIAPLKVISNLFKQANVGQLKGGFLGKIYLDETEVNRLAILPNREVLKGQVADSLSSPLYGLLYMLKANLSSLIYVLSQKT